MESASFMGSRRGQSAHAILGSGKGATRAQTQLQKKLKDATTKAVVEASFKTVASTNPTIGALYLAYKAAKFTYPIAKSGLQEYRRTGDKDKALDKMKEATAKQVGREIKDAVVDTMVGVSVDAAKSAAKVSTTEAADTFVKTAVSETISELIK
jgi:hypothetical protein